MSIESNLATEYSMGNGGFQLVTSTALTTGPFVAITTIAVTTFTSITGNGISGSWSTSAIPAGITLLADYKLSDFEWSGSRIQRSD